MQASALRKAPLAGWRRGATGSELSAARFLLAAGHKPGGMASAAPTRTGVFMQIVAPPTNNQIHGEHLIPADEHWSYRHEKLASPGGCPTVTI
jgi:hypothetical protein